MIPGIFSPADRVRKLFPAGIFPEIFFGPMDRTGKIFAKPSQVKIFWVGIFLENFFGRHYWLP
jgi:hypothetical protein